MKTILLAAGAIALALTAGSTLAAAKHSSKQSMAAGPAQPIPYSELGAYLKASPKQRASQDWWAGANTGAGANASATAAATPSPDAGAASVNPSPSPPAAAPPIDKPSTTAVNPPASAPGAPAETATPPK